VRRAGVLAVDDFVKILGVCTICWFQDNFPTCVINLVIRALPHFAAPSIPRSGTDRRGLSVRLSARLGIVFNSWIRLFAAAF
jgi:hypothetical protein